MEREVNLNKENKPYFKFLNRKILILISLFFLITVISINFSAGATIYVNGSSGSDANDGLTQATAKLTIKNATATVNAGGTVRIADGTYKGPKNRGMIIDKSMSIIGQSQTGTIINAEKQNRIFYIVKGVTTTIRNLTFTNGNTNTSGGAILLDGTLTVTDSTFKGNTATKNGGAIYKGSQGILKVIGSTFTGNIAHDGGGAIVSRHKTLTVTDSIFGGNTASKNGGAIINDDGTVTVAGSTFTGNIAHDGGGAIVNGFGVLIVSRSIFRGNTADDNGGAIVNGGRSVTVSGSTFTGNTAHNGGGAILNGGGTLAVARSTFRGNTANQNGGAILSAGGILRVTGSDLINNTAHGRGGAIYNGLGDDIGVSTVRGDFTVIGSNLIANTANRGGAIYNRGGHGEVHFNRILRNARFDIVSSPGLVDARYNWWGSNRNPSNRVSGNVLVTPWLVATITARPGGSYIITVNLLYDSNGNYHHPSSGHVPDGIPVTFSATGGTVNPPVKLHGKW